MSNPNKYTADAYVVVVPEPNKGVLGFKRYADNSMDADDKGQYMFWFKIGDSGDPMGRLQKYPNPDQGKALVRLTNCPSTKPGKAYESMHLGRIGVTDTEWHALYARDNDQATALCTALRRFLREYQPSSNPVTRTFDDFSLVLGTLVDQRYQNNQADGREVITSPSRVYAIYVLVTPNTNTINLGVANGTSTRYAIQIKSAMTPHITAYTLMGERFKTLIPSFSFNGFRVDTAEEMPRVVEMMQEKLRELLDWLEGEFQCKWGEYDDGWFTVEAADLPVSFLDQFVDWFDEGPVDLLAYNREPNKFPLPERIWSKPAIAKEMKKAAEKEEKMKDDS